MDGTTHVAVQEIANQAAHAIPQPASAPVADAAQVARFEQLLNEAQGKPTMQAPGATNATNAPFDVYVPRAESPMETFGANMLRIGDEVSTAFRKSTEQMNLNWKDGDTLDPASAMQQMADMQRGMFNVSFQLQFVTSLVASANRGVTALFHMQG
jgi:hypothetical protein